MKKLKFLVPIALSILLFSACNNKSENKNANTQTENVKVKRYGMVTGLRPEKVAAYKKLHAAVWPQVLKKITECNIRNYSIYLKDIDGKPYLFSYWEYIGKDFDADMKLMAADTTTQRWWAATSPMQVPVTKDATAVATWSRMEEVFHLN